MHSISFGRNCPLAFVFSHFCPPVRSAARARGCLMSVVTLFAKCSHFVRLGSQNVLTGTHDLFVVIRCRAELPLVTAAVESLRSNVASWPSRALASASR